MHKAIKLEDGSIVYANIESDVTDVGYKKHILLFHCISIFPVILTELRRRYPDKHLDDLRLTATQIAIKSANDQIEKTESIQIPDSIVELLTSDHKKKEQEQLLKGASLTTDQLGAIFLRAEKEGYKYSSYRFEGIPKGMYPSDLPSFIYLDNDGVIHTDQDKGLTNGQLKALIKQANVIVAQIIDNGTNWHCFIRTYSGLKGEESGKHGSIPHIHYLSNKNGITKYDLVKCIKGGYYPTAKIHIPLI